MTNHTELLNFIAEGIQAKTYLEIGCFNLDHNFNHIKVPFKVGVDPDPNAGATFKMTSDEFFIYNTQEYDLILVDGLHEEEQVLRDMFNAHQSLSDKGIIVVHDCNPHKESIAHFPRDSREWTGNVYRAFCRIKTPKITLDFDYGCGIIKKSDGLVCWLCFEMDWEYFDKNRKELLNLVPVLKGIEIIKSWFKTEQYAH